MSGYNNILTEKYLEDREKYTYTDKVFFDAIDKVGVKDKILLDFGCGDGRYALKLANEGVGRIIGIDSSHEMIAQANKKIMPNNVEFLVADGNLLPFPDNSFDLILANYVLVCFKKLHAPLTEIARVLKPGGSLIATVNNAEILDKNTLGKAVPIRLGGSDGVVVYDYLRSNKETKQALTNSGFSINSYINIENLYASVDSEFMKTNKIENFHCILFSATKI